MPIVKEGSLPAIARKATLMAREQNDLPQQIKIITGIPRYYTYLDLGEDWVVMFSAAGKEVEFVGIHKTEPIITQGHPNLRELLDGIANEFGTEYVPEMDPNNTIPKGQTMLRYLMYQSKESG